MKNTFILMLLVMAPFVVWSQIFNHPHIGEQSNLNLLIESVELGDTTKIKMLVCNFTLERYKYWFNPPGSKKAFYLEDYNSGKSYEYLGESGHSSKSQPYITAYEECDTVTLFFEQIASDMRRFNLIEGDKNNSWDFKDINLQRTFENSFRKIVGKTCRFSENIRHQVNFLFSETYNIRYEAVVTEINEEKGQANLQITKAYIIDPSWASINYMNYRGRYAKKAKQTIGSTYWKNASGVNFIIWDK